MQDHWLVRPENIRRLWHGFLAVLALLVAVELVIERHPHFAIEGWYAFNAWYGFLSCVVLVAFAKALGAMLKRPDSYYDNEDYEELRAARRGGPSDPAGRPGHG
jgi:hypothetical protein